MILVDFAPVLPEFFSLGLVGVGLVSWLGDDGSKEVEQEGDVGDELDMDEEDEFGMDGFDDDFDGMDGMDGVEEGGASSTELDNRIEDLESEIANVSSTANTVRSENEQISEKVDDVEENVRKLLEIYEMVTRGVNPFVDDVNPDAGMGGGGGSDFGLFADEDDGQTETDEDLESDIADAEAEDFFEDDAFDDEFEEEDAFDPEDEDFEAELEGAEMADDGFGDFVEDESMNEEESLDDGVTEETETTGDTTGGSDGGTSFEELKAEYESGEAEWAEEDAADESDPGEIGANETESGDESSESDTIPGAAEDGQTDLFHQDDLEAVEESAGAAETDAETEKLDATADTKNTSTVDDPGSGAGDDPQSGADAMTAQEDTGFQFGAATATESTEQPHLDTPPNGYLSDVLIMEWLEFLVGEFDARNAIRAINHYERIDWIGEPMRDHCYEVLQGIAEAEYPYRDESGPTDLTMNDHRRSLRYIENLATGHLDRELGDRITSLTTNGVQR